MRTKWIWGAVAAVVVAVAVVGVLVWPKSGWSGAAIITAIRPDGTVEYDEARFVRAEENTSIAEPIPGTHHTAVLGDQVAIYTAVGDWCAATAGLQLKDGVGANPCTRAEFLATTHERLYACGSRSTVTGRSARSRSTTTHDPDGSRRDMRADPHWATL
ncbi:hypothetical protein SAMN05192558_105304 [Actinokineospora alba]|uniref:Uncharacterized protein n=1 Tax=Actinokineospora alba TaxID=504798 RepID=A0A1H0NDK6_9PSEU|nr:hypothetical protein [Actinokineospora alba]TDP68674.1 hypothetical protein C8E96_4239 [Actinokineospora alba]SDH84195.1 hypothetical protein SAMN05421871_102354 [Actinokineospora alba]SDO90485.1 hypothetical protein SAMN05192558_105304 [Actinokineospora alba]